MFNNGKYGYIDKNNHIRIQPKYQYAGRFFEGYAVAGTNDVFYGYIDKRGNMVIPGIYRGLGRYSEGYARVKTESMWGFIDMHGNISIQMKYIYVSNFRHGIAYAATLDGWMSLDHKGKETKLWKDLSRIPKDIGNDRLLTAVNKYLPNKELEEVRQLEELLKAQEKNRGVGVSANDGQDKKDSNEPVESEE